MHSFYSMHYNNNNNTKSFYSAATCKASHNALHSSVIATVKQVSLQARLERVKRLICL